MCAASVEGDSPRVLSPETYSSWYRGEEEFPAAWREAGVPELPRGSVALALPAALHRVDLVGKGATRLEVLWLEIDLFQYRSLVFLSDAKGWSYLGDVETWRLEPQPKVIGSGNQTRFLVFRTMEGVGAGFMMHSDNWYIARRGDFRRVLTFAGYSHSPRRYWSAVKPEVLGAGPQERIGYTVEFGLECLKAATVRIKTQRARTTVTFRWKLDRSEFVPTPDSPVEAEPLSDERTILAPVFPEKLRCESPWSE